MATQILPQAISIIGFEGGRAGRCFVVPADLEDCARPVPMTPAQVLEHPQFGTLPRDDRERVEWLARRTTERA